MNENSLDQFYTHPDEVQKCVDLLLKYHKWNDFDLFIEPAAGSGSFFDLFPTDKRIGWDLEPRCNDVIQQDFMYAFMHTNPEKTLVLTNPPYGRRASLAKAFLNRSTIFANTLGFVMPRVMKKATQIDSVNRNLHLIDQIDIDRFVLPNGDEHIVKSVFQLWHQKDYPREKLPPKIKSHPDLDIVHAHCSRVTTEKLDELRNSYDLAVGQVSGKIIEASEVKKGSWWYIKFHNKNDYDNFKNITFDDDNTNTINMSLSVTQIIEAYQDMKNLNKINDL